LGRIRPWPLSPVRKGFTQKEKGREKDFEGKGFQGKGAYPQKARDPPLEKVKRPQKAFYLSPEY
jgi:hypothetical protein